MRRKGLRRGARHGFGRGGSAVSGISAPFKGRPAKKTGNRRGNEWPTVLGLRRDRKTLFGHGNAGGRGIPWLPREISGARGETARARLSARRTGFIEIENSKARGTRKPAALWRSTVSAIVGRCRSRESLLRASILRSQSNVGRCSSPAVLSAATLARRGTSPRPTSTGELRSGLVRGARGVSRATARTSKRTGGRTKMDGWNRIGVASRGCK
jgi:hypothetical protein